MKEQFYQTMIKSLMKKNNYLNLSWLLDKGQITEDDYQVEIENNPNLYVIEPNGEVNEEIISTINEILGELNIQLDSNEVSDLFAIDHDSLVKIIEKHQNNEQATSNT
jgi:hypothetical protein